MTTAAEYRDFAAYLDAVITERAKAAESLTGDAWCHATNPLITLQHEANRCRDMAVRVALNAHRRTFRHNARATVTDWQNSIAERIDALQYTGLVGRSDTPGTLDHDAMADRRGNLAVIRSWLKRARIARTDGHWRDDDGTWHRCFPA